MYVYMLINPTILAPNRKPDGRMSSSGVPIVVRSI